MMHIHKGKNNIITTDGVTAEKTDGIKIRKMKYYPERDISALAGEIDEMTAWQIFHDVASHDCNACTPITPEHIFIDGNRFVLSEWSESRDVRFIAPEGYSSVWALAATVFYVYLGCHVFQGLGGKGQTPTAPIPTLRRSLPGLSHLIISCLDFNPVNRPDMAEIRKIAEDNISRCRSVRNDFPPIKKCHDNINATYEIDVYWPEEMY